MFSKTGSYCTKILTTSSILAWRVELLTLKLLLMGDYEKIMTFRIVKISCFFTFNSVFYSDLIVLRDASCSNFNLYLT